MSQRWRIAKWDYVCWCLLGGVLMTFSNCFADAQAPWTEVQACREIEGQLTLRCPTNQRIMIFSANYGNSSGYNCSGHSPLVNKRSSQLLLTQTIIPPITSSGVATTAAAVIMTNDLPALSTTAPPVRCDHDMTSFVKDLCSGRDVCLIEIDNGSFRTPCDGNESLNVRFACIPANQVISICNRNLTSPDGHILSPGYPEYYPGPSDCSWRISAEVGKNILIMLNDLSLRPQSAKDNVCQDYLTIYENDNRQLIKTCHSYPFNLQVASNTARISLVSNSIGWTSKGVWLFYKAVGCSNPILPELVKLSRRNYTTAMLKCQEGFFFHDVRHPFEELALRCVDGLEWDRTVPNCINDSEWRRNALAERELFRRQNEPIEMMNNATLQEIVIPSTIIGALLLVLIAALGIVLTLRRHRRRGVIYHNHEIEHLHIVRKAPRAQLDSATDLELARGGGMSYPLTLTEIRD
ncbi:hypothetical protein BV898_18323 [Hypsibius exemplaris]|uniref:CUB domain-containing protein n=1 Tax=Hypsibius exemplaris TaxID=2072580 RepID=A0A9X6NQ38_HYPEX|nr:hypothetical protein BV898_18323 [Hypsibius exemplaris]